MKRVVDLLRSKSIVLRSLEKIDLTLLGSRKKIDIFSGVTQDSFYIEIFLVEQKSRFLRKNADEMLTLSDRLEKIKGHIYAKRILFISSPLCSKAKGALEENGWHVEKVER